MSRKCEYAGCDEVETVARISEVNGETYWYCGEHDPLAGDGSDAFTEADVDA
jgi:hypothetical protein